MTKIIHVDEETNETFYKLWRLTERNIGHSLITLCEKFNMGRWINDIDVISHTDYLRVTNRLFYKNEPRRTWK